MEWFTRFWNSFVLELLNKLSIGKQDIAEAITELLDFSAVTVLRIGSFEIPITKAIINIVVTIVAIVAFSLFVTKKPKHVTPNKRLAVVDKTGEQSNDTNVTPNKRLAVVESLLNMLENLCRSSGLNEQQTRKFAPFAASIALFILISNLLSVFSLEPAAVNPAFPIALAFFTVICVIVWGVYFTGIKGFFRSLVAPKAFMLPFNILDYFIKPLSLAFRLFGNIFGASILIAFLKAVVPLIVPQALGLWFDIGDGIIQAIVFCYLSITYIGEIVERGNTVHETDKTII